MKEANPREPLRAGRKTRGHGTHKTPVIGAVERGGQVIARVATDLTGPGIVRSLKDTIDPHGSLLITDEYKAYRAIRSFLPHAVITHRRSYVEGQPHTNTLEGFCALLKRAWYDSHHHYSRRYLPLYVAEACGKSNERKIPHAFGLFLQGCVA